MQFKSPRFKARAFLFSKDLNHPKARLGKILSIYFILIFFLQQSAEPSVTNQYLDKIRTIGLS